MGVSAQVQGHAVFSQQRRQLFAVFHMVTAAVRVAAFPCQEIEVSRAEDGQSPFFRMFEHLFRPAEGFLGNEGLVVMPHAGSRQVDRPGAVAAQIHHQKAQVVTLHKVAQGRGVTAVRLVKAEVRVIRRKFDLPDGRQIMVSRQDIDIKARLLGIFQLLRQRLVAVGLAAVDQIAGEQDELCPLFLCVPEQGVHQLEIIPGRGQRRPVCAVVRVQVQVGANRDAQPLRRRKSSLLRGGRPGPVQYRRRCLIPLLFRADRGLPVPALGAVVAELRVAAAGDHDFLGVRRPEAAAFFICVTIQDAVPVSVYTEIRHFPGLSRGIGRQHHKPRHPVRVRGGKGRRRDAAEGMAREDPVLIIIRRHQALCRVDAKEGKMQRHFRKKAVHSAVRDPPHERRVGRGLYLCARIEHERCVLSRSVKEPGAEKAVSQYRFLREHGACLNGSPVINREVEENGTQQNHQRA